MKIKNAIDQKTKRIINNLSYLSVIQVVTLLAPFVYYPYLLRIIGAGNYGSIVIVQSVFIILSLFIEFGFNINGTKLIIKAKDSKIELEKLVSNIIYIKIILFIFITSFSLFFTFFVLDIDEEYKILVLCFIPTLLYDVFFCQWYFQGLDKIKFCAINNGVVKLFTIVFVFIFIREDDDGYLFAIILSLTNIIVAILVTYHMYFIDKLRPQRFDLKYSCSIFKETFVFFYSKFFSSCIIRFNILLVGYALGPNMVAFYDICLKVTNLLLIPFYMLNQAIYPVVVEARKLDITKFVLSISLPLSLLLITSLYSYGYEIITFISGGEFNINYSLLFLFSLYVPFQVVSIFLGNTALVVFGKNKEFGYSTGFGLMLYSMFLFYLYIFNDFNIYNIILLNFIYTFAVFCFRYYYAVIKYKLFEVKDFK